MGTQISIFDGANKYVNDKPIRLIECFAGYGSQALALKYLGIPFEHHRIAEWAVKSIQAYKDMHFPDDDTDYSWGLTFDNVIDYLFERGISADYNKPMTREQIKRMGENKCRTVYNNVKATHNLVSVCNVKAKDLEITDTDRFTYLLTYSFPCQDLSKAGNRRGMDKDSGTRSGLLWEIERILKECDELPQILLMENVPDVIGEKNKSSFAEWISFLEGLGYRSYWKILNGKDYEIAQNRERCFMISILGDYYYDFPEAKPLKVRLKDFLESEVDEKYYCDKNIKLEDLVPYGSYYTWKDKQGNLNTECNRACDPNGYSLTLPTFPLIKVIENISCECIGMLKGGKWDKMHEISRRVYSTDGCCPTLHTCGGGNLEPKIATNNSRIRKITPIECFRLMGVKDEDYERVAENQSKSSLYHLAGDSIVVNVLMSIFKELFA